jgi:hypothetical protein
MLVTISDLTSYMDIRFSLRQQDAAEMVLAGLQSELEAYLRRPIEVSTFVEEITLPITHVGMPTDSFFYNTSVDTSMKPLTYSQPSPTLYLRNSPVTKVHSVQIRNTSTAGTFFGEGIDREATVTAATQTGPNVTFTANGHKFTKGQTVLTLAKSPNPSGHLSLVERQKRLVTTMWSDAMGLIFSVDLQMTFLKSPTMLD